MYINNINFNRILQDNMEKLRRYMQNLSTGKRINSASDDASGLQISTRMTAQNKNGVIETAAQRIGITKKKFNIKDIIYMQ